MADFEAAKAFISQEVDGASVHDHLTEVLLKILTEKRADALDSFEHISASVKRARAQPARALDGEAADKEPMSTSSKAALTKWAAANAALFKAGDEDAGAAVQDLVHEMDVLEWAGVGIGREECFRLFLSMKKLAASAEVSHLRFWGKLLGRNADYFVVEGEAKDDEEEEDSKAVEGATGANKYSYWVCNHVGEPWVRLPKVRPEHVVGARHLRRFLTGSLDSEVAGHPPFPGKEREFLRAQIARITSATLISPEGLFGTPDEDNPLAIEPTPAEEQPEREPEDLKALGSWVHLHLEVNVLGRCLPVEKLDENGDPVEDEDAVEQVPPLRALEEEEGDWAVSVSPAVAGGSPNSLVCVRSMRWPGACAVAFGRRFTNVYVGYGLKHAAEPYTPLPPAELQAEFNEPEFREQEDVLDNPAPEGEGEAAEGGEEEDE